MSIIWGSEQDESLWSILQPLVIGLLAVAGVCAIAYHYGAWR